ncbi:MAG: O-antigen/teichoic acid export membrane protein [Woeseiaceae bacterium]|jgi:O-antigen/teichoic acid export membrane protein
MKDKSFAIFNRDALLFFSTLLTGIVIARQLGPEMMGVWTILLLIPGYAEAIGRLKFDVSSVYFLGQKKAALGELTFLLHILATLAALVMVLVFIGNFEWFYKQLFQNVEVDVRAFAYTILSIIPLRLIYLNYSYLLVAIEDFRAYNVQVILQALVTSFFSIGLILVFGLGIIGALIGSIIGLTVSIVYGAVKVQGIERINPGLNPRLILSMAKYAFAQYLSGLIGYFQGNIASLIAAFFMHPAQIAFYAIGKSICEVANRMVPVAISTVLFPLVSKTVNASESTLLTARLFRITLLILSVSSLSLAVLIKPVVLLLYGSEYLPLITPFIIMLPGVVLSQSSSVFASWFSGVGRPDLLSKIAIFPLLVQIAGAWILIPEFGINGASASFLLSALLLFLFTMICFVTMGKLRFSDMIIRFEDIVTVWKFFIEKLSQIIQVIVTNIPGR